ncbi:hypothetical protein CNMCM5793_004167 [Aspergillus hiratsukae]|uniref:Phosphatidylglycerol lysyltransferase C-terminal domain-containing protein n=1 Tax=Aspergillus hiratsukae TaxID=1194566 RepID=A0A8H6P2S0_9EURO|nr:hypothetical protein CNMCM5793_004167 [Aspergillus hiratsukae]KAF7159126.1 hypothetical protein CNMCM6106_006211 [Aspergillus hiratsukae]
MANSVSTDLNVSHSALRFLFKHPKKWTQRHLDTLSIQEHENISVTEMVRETNLPANDDPAYRLLTLQITLPSREDILNIAKSESWLQANGLTWVFDAIHRLAKTPEGKTPPEDLFGGILNNMAFWYRYHYAEAKNVPWLGDFSPGKYGQYTTNRFIPSVDNLQYCKKPDAENRMKREIPFGLFLAFAAFDRNPTLDEYTSFVFNLRRTSVQLTKVVATRSYLRALCEGREVSEHLQVYRSAEYDIVERDGRKEFLTLFLGAMNHSLRQFSARREMSSPFIKSSCKWVHGSPSIYNTPSIPGGRPTNPKKSTNANKERSKHCRAENSKTEGCRRVLLAETIGLSLHDGHARLTKWDVNDISHNLFEHHEPSVKAASSGWLSVPSHTGRSSGSTRSSTSTSDDTLAATSSDTWPSGSSCISEEDAHSHRGSSINVSRKHLPYKRIISLDGLVSVEDVERLATQHGQASHMGLLDPSYNVFVKGDRAGGLCFKVLNKVAIVMGDPMCEASQVSSVLDEFDRYRRQNRWAVSFLGAGEMLLSHVKARKKKWTVLQFGKERVLNPLTNEVIHETSGKRILTQNRQLLNPSKGGITLHIYTPSLEADYELEIELCAIYDEWRMARNKSGKLQAFITEYDPFLMPSLMTYIYSRGQDGKVNGFAALRWIGGKNGYHVDPCIAAPGAPKGISDLLIFASMAWLRQIGVSYLSFGYEPSDSLAEVSGMPSPLAHLTRQIYRYTFQRLPIGGKKTYFDKFKPDEEQDSPLYLVFPSKIPEPRSVIAMAHVANISIRKLLFDHPPKPSVPQ